MNLQDYRNLSSIGCQGLLLCMLSAQVRGNTGPFSLQVQILGVHTHTKSHISRHRENDEYLNVSEQMPQNSLIHK